MRRLAVACDMMVNHLVYDVVIGFEMDHAKNSNSYINIHQRGDGEELRGYVQ
jgi:hypothetical protein